MELDLTSSFKPLLEESLKPKLLKALVLLAAEKDGVYISLVVFMIDVNSQVLISLLPLYSQTCSVTPSSMLLLCRHNFSYLYPLFTWAFIRPQ